MMAVALPPIPLPHPPPLQPSYGLVDMRLIAFVAGRRRGGKGSKGVRFARSFSLSLPFNACQALGLMEVVVIFTVRL